MNKNKYKLPDGYRIAEKWSISKPHKKVQQSPYGSYVQEWGLIDSKGNFQKVEWNQGWIETDDGGNVVNEGDYILEDDNGSFHVIPREIFEGKLNDKFVRVKDWIV